MASLYPNRLDNDATLPAVYDDITEMGGIAIDSLRSAVFNIERTLGINPQGTANDLVTRLDKSFNSDGTIKGDALLSLGYVVLPIINDYIAFNAGIEESKLSLDFTTTQLKTWIDELWDLFWPLSTQENQLIHEMRLHFQVPMGFGKHQTQDIDGYVGHYIGYNLQGIIADLDSRIENHINDLIAAHAASAIFVDDSRLEFTTSDVQDALEQLDLQISTNLFINHSGDQHGNVISPVNKTFVSGTNYNVNIIESSLLKPFSVGSRDVQFHILPSNIGDVSRGDRINIVVDSITYSYIIYNVNVVNGFVYFTGSIPVSSDGAYATIYKTEVECNVPSVLKAVIRNKQINDICGSIIQLIHPSAAFVISDGFDARKITSPSHINIAWEGGETGDINLYELMVAYNSKSSTWTVDSVIETLNAYFAQDYPFAHFPVIAFESNGELGFALDEPGGYLETKPVFYSAWETLGFVEDKKYYSVGPRKLYLDGYEYNEIKTLVDSTGSTNGSVEIINIADDLLESGVRRSGIVRVTGHATDNGTFAFNQVYAHKLIVGEHNTNFDTDSVGIKIYSDTFSLHFSPPKRTLYELFVQGPVPPGIEFNGAARVEYCNSLWAKNNPEDWFDVIAVSRGFSECERRLFFDGNYNVSLGEVSSECTIINPGNVVALPIEDAEGFQFRLYDGGKVNYIDFQVASAGYIVSSVYGKENSIDIFIHDRISEKKYLQVGTVLHNKKQFKNFSDRRVIGNVNRKQIGTDFIKDKIYATTDALRANGIIYGFETNGSASTVVVDGGLALLNGAISIISTTEFGIPTDNINVTYNIFIDYDGVLKLLRNDYYEWGVITTPTLLEIINSNRVMISQVIVNASNVITSIKDYRKFVNMLDNKLDLIVSNNIETGMFLSLRSAVNYMNAFGESYSGSRKIIIRGIIEHSLDDGELYFLDGVILCGDNESAEIHLIGSGDFIIPGSNCTIENINISNEIVEVGKSIFGQGTSETDSTITIDGLKILNCKFTNISGRMIVNGKTVNNCIIENCDFGLSGVREIICANTSFNNIVVKNCYFHEASVSSSISRLFLLTGGSDFVFKDNLVNFTISYSASLFCFMDSTNICFQNNIIKATSTSSTTGIIEFLSSGNEIIIENNTFEVNSYISTGAIIAFNNWSGYLTTNYCENILINNNIFNTTGSTLINNIILVYGKGNYYEDTINSCYITNNIVEGGLINNSILIQLGRQTVARDIKILNNNISVGNIGQNIIKCCGGTGINSATFKDIFIMNNFLRNRYSIGLTHGYFIYIYNLEGVGEIIEICNNVLINDVYGVCAEEAVEIYLGNEIFDLIKINNNIFKNFVGTGVYTSLVIFIWDGFGGAKSIVINNNIFENCQYAVFARCETQYDLCFENNIVCNATAFNTSGIDSAFVLEASPSRNLVITDNTIYNAASCGNYFEITLYHYNQISETNYVFKNNNIAHLVPEFDYDFASAIYFSCSSAASHATHFDIDNNTITGNFEIIFSFDSTLVSSPSSVLNTHSANISNTVYVGRAGCFVYGPNLWLPLNINNNVIINNLNQAVAMHNNLVETTQTVCKSLQIKNNICINNIETFGFIKALSLTYGMGPNIDTKDMVLSIEGNVFKNFDNVSSYGIFVYNKNNNVFINSNKMFNCKYPVYVQNLAVVASAGNYSICDNIIENIGVVTSSIIRFDNVDKNILVSGNIINTDSNNTFIIYLNGTNGNINICNNSITSSATETYTIRIVGSSELKNITIADNKLQINNSTSNIIYVYGSGIFNPIIKDNHICVGNTTGGCIYLQASTTGINNGVFVGNSVFCNSTSSLVTKSVLVSKGINNNIIISDNEFINLTPTKGFENCIYLDDSAKNIVISNNIMLNFDYGTSGTAIQFENGESILISKNIISAVYSLMSVVGTANKDIIFYGNYCKNTIGKMVIAFSNADLDNISIISNHFRNTSISMTGTFVSISSATGSNCIVNNNVFTSNHTSSSSYNMLKVDTQNNCFVCNNIFGNNIEFSLPPIDIGTDDSLAICAFNNLKTCFISGITGGDLVSVTGSNYCNFGEHYAYNVPLSSLFDLRSNSGPGSWGFIKNTHGGHGDYVYEVSDASFLLGCEDLVFPINLPVTKFSLVKIIVEYYCSVDPAGMVNFSIKKKNSISGDIEEIIPVTEFSLGTGVNTETIFDTYTEVKEFETYMVIFSAMAVSSPPWTFALSGLLIDYIFDSNTLVAVTLISMVITFDGEPNIDLYDTKALTVTGIYSDLTTADVTASCSFESSAPTIVSCSDNEITAEASGSATITATHNVYTTIHCDSDVSVPVILLSMVISFDGEPDIDLGDTKALTVIGTYSDSTTADVTASCSFESSAPTIVSCSDNEITAEASGDAIITATHNVYTAIHCYSSVSVPVILLSMIISFDGEPDIDLGDTKALTVIGTYSDSTTADVTASCSFESSAPTIVSCSGNEITAEASGDAIITATHNVYTAIHCHSDVSVTAPVAVWAERRPLSVDADKNWSALASSSDGAKLVAVVHGSGRIYTSVDSGVSWEDSRPAGDVNKSWWSVASSSDGNKLIVGEDSGRLYTSVDSGASWSESRPLGNISKLWRAVASSSNGSKLIVGDITSGGGRLYTSVDSGASWTPRATSEPWWAAASSSDGAKLIAGVCGAYGGRLYTSVNSGASWTERRPLNVNADKLWRPVASSSDGTKLIVGVYGGRLYTSVDSGVSWTERRPLDVDADKNWSALASSSDGTKLIAGVSGGRLYTSVDSGVSWEEEQPAGDVNKSWWSAASNADGTVLLAGIYGGRLYVKS